MLNFIIYEDCKKMIEIYKKVIDEFVGKRKDGYHTLIFSQFDKDTKKKIKEIDGRKIFLLDIEVPGKSGIDLAREIRRSGDWISQIIIISAFERFKYDVFSAKLLALDFISKGENISSRLKESLVCAYDIATTYRSFSFQFEGDIYHVPYQDILYFAKDLNDNYTSIVTNNHTFKVKKSISEIEKLLHHDLRFFKTHQSCIVNLHRIVSVDMASSIIHFEKANTPLLARNKKKELKERLTNC